MNRLTIPIVAKIINIGRNILPNMREFHIQLQGGEGEREGVERGARGMSPTMHHKRLQRQGSR